MDSVSRAILMAGGGGLAPITFVGSAQASSATTTLTINKPTNTVDGDLMVAMVCHAAGTTWTPPAGWSTLFSSTTAAEMSVSGFWRVAASEGASYAFTASTSNNNSGCILTYRNAAMGFAGGIVSGNTTPQVAPQVAIPPSGGLLIGFGTRNNNSVTWTTPSGMSTVASDSDATAPSWAVFSEVRASGATGTRSFSSVAGVNGASVLFFLYPSSYTPPSIEFIASASQQNTATGNSLTINRPSGTQSGDIMIAVMAASGSVTNWTDATFTEVADQGAASPGLRVAYKVAGGSEPSSYTFTNSDTFRTLAGSILTYRGAAYDTIGAFATGADPLVITGPTAAANWSRLIGVAARNQSGITVTAPASMTTRVTDSDATGPSYAVADEVVGAGATGTRSFGMGLSSNVAGILLTIKPA